MIKRNSYITQSLCNQKGPIKIIIILLLPLERKGNEMRQIDGVIGSVSGDMAVRPMTNTIRRQYRDSVLALSPAGLFPAGFFPDGLLPQELSPKIFLRKVLFSACRFPAGIFPAGFFPRSFPLGFFPAKVFSLSFSRQFFPAGLFS